MKIPEPAPRLDMDIDFSKIALSEGLDEILRKANEQYLYWDKFKHLTLPASISDKEAWVYFRLMRNFQLRKIPLKNTKDKAFGYWLPDNLQRTLHYIDQNAGGQIFAADQKMPSGEIEKYIVNSLMEEAIASSQLEGAATTRKKAKEMLRSGRKPVNNS